MATEKVLCFIWAVALGCANFATFSEGAETSRTSHLVEFSFKALSNVVPGYATAQSHNQLLVGNSRGIFLAYLDAFRHGPEKKSSWTLLHSEDKGGSFRTLYHASGSVAPTVETDEEDNIYVFSSEEVEGGGGKLVFYKFASSHDFQLQTTKSITITKHFNRINAYYDRGRRLFYFFPDIEAPFMILDKNGEVVRSVQLFFTGSNAILEYPHLAMDGPDLFLAWTTATPIMPYRYYSIHWMRSHDGGRSWAAPDGGAIQPPIASDDTGPFPAISRGAWLSSFRATKGALHFMYLSEGREIYRRIAPEQPGSSSEPASWEAEGLGIHSLDGFLTVHGRSGTIYAIGADYRQQNPEGLAPIIVLKSFDEGKNWHSHARSTALYRPYALGGPRFTLDHFGIIGMFTNFKGSHDPPANDLIFFRVPL